jgi:hypothetical protein
MRSVLVVLCLAAVCILAMPAHADELAQTGRQIIAKWQDAVVTVQLVVKTTVTYEGEQSPPQEDRVEANGVVIDPSGLVVTALSEISPDETAADYMGEEADKYKVSTDISDVKILVGAQEIPATVVLRDKELDLAFIRPAAKPAKPMTAVDPAKGSKPALLDEILGLSRQGMVASRALAASFDRIETVVEKPRFFSIPDQGLDMGASVFTLDGGFAGLVVLRQLPAAAGNNDWYTNSAQIILPASEIAQAAKQAP